MANYLIKELDNVVNFICTDTGEVYLFTATKAGNAQVKGQGSTKERLAVYDGIGGLVGGLDFTNNTISTQDNGGSSVVFGGTILELADKVNNEYFDNASSVSIAPTPTPPLSDTFSGLFINLDNPDSGTFTGIGFEIANIGIQGLDFQFLYEGYSSIVNTTLDLVTLLNTAQRAYTFIVLSDTEIGAYANERPLEDFILLTFEDISNGEVLEYNKNIVTGSTSPTTEQELLVQAQITGHSQGFGEKAVTNVNTKVVANTNDNLIKANEYRKELILTNGTNKDLYVKLGTIPVGVDDRTFPIIEPEGYAIIDKYKGDVYYTFSDDVTPTGFLHITETV